MCSTYILGQDVQNSVAQQHTAVDGRVEAPEERLHAARRVRPDGRPSKWYLQSLGGLVTDGLLRGLVKL